MRSFLEGGNATNAYLAGGENARCVACFDRSRTRGLFRGSPGSQGYSILESHLVHDHDAPDVAGGERTAGVPTNARMIGMERSTTTSACESLASSPDATTSSSAIRPAAFASCATSR